MCSNRPLDQALSRNVRVEVDAKGYITSTWTVADCEYTGPESDGVPVLVREPGGSPTPVLTPGVHDGLLKVDKDRKATLQVGDYLIALTGPKADRR